MILGSWQKNRLSFFKAKSLSDFSPKLVLAKAEIDIIARKGNIIHIVEVKARSSDDFITPEEAVNRKKRKLLIMAANEFVQNLEEEVEVQFDIISILSENGKFTLEYIDDAFESID